MVWESRPISNWTKSSRIKSNELSITKIAKTTKIKNKKIQIGSYHDDTQDNHHHGNQSTNTQTHNKHVVFEIIKEKIQWFHQIYLFLWQIWFPKLFYSCHTTIDIITTRKSSLMNVAQLCYNLFIAPLYFDDMCMFFCMNNRWNQQLHHVWTKKICIN